MFTEGNQTRAIRVEEIHHAITQIGYGKAYPKIFATDNGWTGTSTLVTECKKARCDWWQHPENSCTSKKPTLPRLNCMQTWASQPGRQYPGNGGSACTSSEAKSTCDYPSCDCIEWYHQVELQFKSKILISPQRFIAPLILMPHFFYISLDCIALCWTNTRLDLWN